MMIVIKDNNSNDRVDILGINNIDLQLIIRGLENLKQIGEETDKDKIKNLINKLNDNNCLIDNYEKSSSDYDNKSSYKLVDLGLPSGTLWTDRNIGASAPEQVGLYFAWGETNGFTAEQIKAGEHSFCPKYYKGELISNNLTAEQDAANVILGPQFRMPTYEDYWELISYCNIEWIINHNETGTTGKLFTSKSNGNSIFLPFAGYCNGIDMEYQGFDGDYWTSTKGTADNSYYLDISQRTHMVMFGGRYIGRTIRAVCTK